MFYVFFLQCQSGENGIFSGEVFENLKKIINDIGTKEERIDALIYSAGCSMAIPLEYTKKSEYYRPVPMSFFCNFAANYKSHKR